MQNTKDTQKALIDIRNMINGVGEHTTQAVEKIQKSIEALVKAAIARNEHYHRAYLKHGLQEVMLSGQVHPTIAKQLLPTFKSAIEKLDGKLGKAYEKQAALTQAAKAKPEAKKSTTPRMK